MVYRVNTSPYHKSYKIQLTRMWDIQTILHVNMDSLYPFQISSVQLYVRFRRYITIAVQFIVHEARLNFPTNAVIELLARTVRREAFVYRSHVIIIVLFCKFVTITSFFILRLPFGKS